MFAVLHFPQFALQAALRHEPELWSRPVALVDPAMTTPRVCDMTASAAELGITALLTPTQALARCREVLIRHRSPTQETAATNAVLQCAYGFSPNIENTSAGTVTLDLRGLSELSQASLEVHRSILDPSRLQDWATRLRTAVASLNLLVRIGIGPTPNVASHAAHWSDHNSLQQSATVVNDTPSFIRTLPVAALGPSTDVAIILDKWGVGTVGQLLDLGQDAVMDRLGLEALALFAAASTDALRPLHLVRPAEHYEETFEFENEVETVEPLLFILRRFVDSIGHRLELAGLAAARLTLRLRLDSGEILERHLRLPQPTRRADIVFRMLQTHLETLRTDSPIVSVGLKVDPTEPGQRQFSLFETALRDPHQFQETLARLSALVGADRVGTPVRENSHRPDAFTLIPPDFESAPPARSTEGRRKPVPELLRVTPLRRLRPAIEATVELGLESPKAISGNTPPRPRRKDDPSLPPKNNIVELIGPLFSAPKPGSSAAENPASTTRSTGEATWPPAFAVEPVPATPPPIALHSKIAKGKLAFALGPWRASGRWWEPSGWERDEWDVQTRDGKAFRLVRRPGGWFVEALVD